MFTFKVLTIRVLDRVHALIGTESFVYRRSKDVGTATGEWMAELSREDAWFRNVVPNVSAFPYSLHTRPHKLPVQDTVQDRVASRRRRRYIIHIGLHQHRNLSSLAGLAVLEERGQISSWYCRARF